MSSEEVDRKDSKDFASPSPDDQQDTRIAEVYNADFKQAVEETTLDPWSKTSFQLYFIVMVGFLNAVSSGFDGSLMGGINAMPQYLNFVRLLPFYPSRILTLVPVSL